MFHRFMNPFRQLVLLFAVGNLSVAGAAEVVVSAASSLTQAFQEIAVQYESKYPDTKIRLNFAASGVLLQQIINGAPVDVFASADTDTMEKAIAKSLVRAADSSLFTANRLVLIAPVQSTAQLKQLSDLKNPDTQRIAMGVAASVPAGPYPLGTLQTAGLWNEVKDKIIYTQNVKQALDYVVRGEVDAGFVYASEAQLVRSKVKVAFVVDTSTPIQYPIARTATSLQPEAANKFIAFVQSPAGQAVLKKHGFGH